MNSTSSVITLTFGDSAENHVGMEKIGSIVSKGNGFTPEELAVFSTQFPNSELYTLSTQPWHSPASVLVVRGRHRYNLEPSR